MAQDTKDEDAERMLPAAIQFQVGHRQAEHFLLFNTCTIIFS